MKFLLGRRSVSLNLLGFFIFELAGRSALLRSYFDTTGSL